MVDVADEVSADYHRRVGELVCRLAERGVLVKVGKQNSILSDSLLQMTVTRVHKNKAHSIYENFSREALMQVSDIRVVADAIYRQLVEGAK